MNYLGEFPIAVNEYTYKVHHLMLFPEFNSNQQNHSYDESESNP